MKLATLATLLILITLCPAAMIALAESVPLDYRDSGYDLAAGYRYAITLRSCHIWCGAAVAAVEAGPFRAQLQGGHLVIEVNGEKVFDQDIGRWEATIYITVDCDGGASIELAGYGHIGGFSIDRSYRIMEYTSTADCMWQRCSSSVSISRQRVYNCNYETNPELRPVEESHGFDLLAALGGATAVAVMILLLGFGILLLLIFFSQARRRGWISFSSRR